MMTLEKPVLLERKDGATLSELLHTGNFGSVLIPFWHGVGDVVMFVPVVDELRRKFPMIKIDLGLCRGLDQESFVPDAVLLEGDWRENALMLGYDLVYPVNFPLERLEDTTKTKAEVCCEEEIGIVPICGHKKIIPKKLVAVTFQMTSVPWVANADKELAEKIWKDIKDADCVPMECLIPHVFHNPSNERYDFIDTHVRSCAARLETLMALLGRCDLFIGVVGGPFHLALSILGPQKVMLLEKDLKAGHFTKERIATCDLKNYNSEAIKRFIGGIN